MAIEQRCKQPRLTARWEEIFQTRGNEKFFFRIDEREINLIAVKKIDILFLPSMIYS